MKRATNFASFSFSIHFISYSNGIRVYFNH